MLSMFKINLLSDTLPEFTIVGFAVVGCKLVCLQAQHIVIAVKSSSSKSVPQESGYSE